MNYRQLGAFALGAVALATVPVVNATSVAADSTDCFSGFICMWEDSDYTGSRYVLETAWPGDYEIGGIEGDNEISSVINFSDYCVRLYDNDDQTGTSYLVGKQRLVPDLTQNGFDNEAESYRIYVC